MIRFFALTGCLFFAVLKLAGQAAVSYGGIGEPAVAPGDPSSSYALTGLDHVNYYSGQVNLTIPVRSIGGRGSAADNILIPIQRQWSVDNEFGSYVPGSNGWPIGSGLYTSGSLALYTVSGNANQCVTYDQYGNPIGYSQLGPFLSYIVWTRIDGTQTILRDLKSNGQPQNAQVQSCGQTYTPYDRGTVFQSSDGTDLTFVASSDVYDGQGTMQGTLITRDGTKYSFSADTYVSGIEDRNGNQMQFAFSSTPSGGIYTVSDSVGRTETINFTENLYTDTQDVITYPGTNGTPRTVTVNYALLQDALAPGETLQTYSQLFPELNGSSSTTFNPYVISSVGLADGTSYTIRYNAYGEPARLTLPTGGAYAYVYSEAYKGGSSGVVNLGNGNYSIYRRVQERDELADGSNVSGRIVFSNGTATSDPSHSSRAATLFTATFEDAGGNVLRAEKHSFYGNPAPANAPASNATQFADWWLGLEYQTEIDDPAAGMLQAQQRVYGQRGCPGAGEGNCWYTPSDDASPSHDTQLGSVTTALGNGEQSEVAYGYDQYNNVTDEYDYDWGSGEVGGLLRHVQKAYGFGTAYLNPSVNLVGLNTLIAVSDGAGHQQSYTLLNYDEHGLQDDSSIVGHDSAYNINFSPRGNLTTVWRSQDGSNNVNIISAQYTYDIAGNMVLQKDGNGNATTIGYNDDGQNRYALPTSTTNALNQATHASYDYNIEKPVSITDANNAVTQYAYNDALDRLTNVIRADNGRTSVYYESPTWTVICNDQNTSNDCGHQAWSAYDGLGRLTEQRTYDSSTTFIAVDLGYDALGRIAWQNNPTRVTFTPAVSNDGLGYRTSYSYDALGRRAQTLTADGAATNTSYIGNTATVTDPASTRRTNTTDALGRLTVVQEDPNGLNYTTNYTYDALSNLTGVTQGSQTRSFAYDGLNRLTQAVNPESGTTNYGYDSAGNLTWKQDSRGVQTWHGYDGLNRITQTSYSDGTAGVSYGYDAGGTPAHAIGQLTSVGNGDSTTSYTAFDVMGRVTASQQVTAGLSYSFAYGYDLAGELTSETYPTGRVIHNAYNPAGQAADVTGVLNGVTTPYAGGVSYWPSGATTCLWYGNNVVPCRIYNNRLQPSSVYATVNNSGNNYLGAWTYNWGGNTNNGNLLTATEYYGNSVPFASLSSFTQYYAYDGLSRLYESSDTGGWWRNFGYDRWGNAWLTGNTGAPLAGNTPTSNIYNAANNQMGGQSYDAGGNQTSANGNTETYDAETRLVQVAEAPAFGGETAQFGMDGLGQRVWKSQPGEALVYAYDAFGNLVSQNAWTAVADEYIRLGGQVIAIEHAGGSPCATCYLNYDHPGSLRLVTDQNANVVARHDYLPFGEEIPAGWAGRSAPFGSNDSVNLKFTGQFRDSETGLDYFNARYFGAALGRFTSPDPANAGADLTDPQTWNGYSYVRNNPMNATDPSGACSIGDDGIAHDDSPGDCGGGSTTVDGGAPDEVSTDPCFYLNCWGGGGGPLYSITYTELVPVPKPGPPTLGGPPNNGNYRTLDCDGYRAARSILPQTTKQGIEFGGFLYQNSNGRYSYSNPVAGEPTSIPDLFKSPQAFVSGIVGWFHTHPLVPGFNNDRFSGSDLLITRKEGPGYLGTASGRILKLATDPKGLPHTTDVNSGACQVP